jgi:hypothetical protein
MAGGRIQIIPHSASLATASCLGVALYLYAKTEVPPYQTKTGPTSAFHTSLPVSPSPPLPVTLSPNPSSPSPHLSPSPPLPVPPSPPLPVPLSPNPFLIPHSHRGVGPYGPEAAFPLPPSIPPQSPSPSHPVPPSPSHPVPPSPFSASIAE